MAIKLLDPTTAAETSLNTAVRKAQTFIANGLSTGESAVVQIRYDNENFMDLYLDGSLVELTSVNNAVTVYGPGVYRVSKSVTANPVSIYSSSVDTP